MSGYFLVRKNNEMKFKEGERVFVYPYGWGELTAEIYDDRAYVRFSNGAIHPCGNNFISFTEYDLINGGFSHERLKPKIKGGQMIWVKLGSNTNFVMREFIRWDGSSVKVLSSNSQILVKCSEYSILNPNTDSIEARAIELLRELKDLIPTRNLSKIYSIEKFFKEIDNLKQ